MVRAMGVERTQASGLAGEGSTRSDFFESWSIAASGVAEPRTGVHTLFERFPVCSTEPSKSGVAAEAVSAASRQQARRIIRALLSVKDNPVSALFRQFTVDDFGE